MLIVLVEGERLRHGAAPDLPAELSAAIEGLPIGPHMGSCGAAAYLRERVIIADIGTHPNWGNYRHLALPFQLRACWSSPIFADAGGDVLGTFAMYYQEPRPPSAREVKWVARATHLAAIAIRRDRNERALRHSESRYRQIVDTAYEGVWLLDADACTVFINGRAAEMLGHATNEVLGRSVLDFMDEPSRRAAEGTFLVRLRTISDQQQFRFRRKDGSFMWALMAASPIRDDKQQVVGALGMLTDITDLKDAEAALRQSEAEFRVLFESAAIGMALVEAGGHIVRSNPALLTFLGYDENDLRKLKLGDIIHPEEPPAERESCRASCAASATRTRASGAACARTARRSGAG